MILKAKPESLENLLVIANGFLNVCKILHNKNKNGIPGGEAEIALGSNLVLSKIIFKQSYSDDNSNLQTALSLLETAALSKETLQTCLEAAQAAVFLNYAYVKQTTVGISPFQSKDARLSGVTIFTNLIMTWKNTNQEGKIRKLIRMDILGKKVESNIIDALHKLGGVM